MPDEARLSEEEQEAIEGYRKAVRELMPAMDNLIMMQIMIEGIRDLAAKHEINYDAWHLNRALAHLHDAGKHIALAIGTGGNPRAEQLQAEVLAAIAKAKKKSGVDTFNNASL